MSQILLIRPGETEFDRDRRIQGNLNVPLSPEGRCEVRRVCREVGQMLQSREGSLQRISPLQMRPLRILCVAPGDPSQETARMLTRGFSDSVESDGCLDGASHDGSVEVIPALRCRKIKTVNGFANLDQGLWQGMLIDDIRRSQPKIYRLYQESPECVCPPEGEALPEARVRVLSALDKLLRRYRDPNDVIGIVVSAPIAGIIRQYLGGCELDDLWETFDEHGRWELLESVPERMVA